MQRSAAVLGYPSEHPTTEACLFESGEDGFMCNVVLRPFDVEEQRSAQTFTPFLVLNIGNQVDDIIN